MSFMQFVLSLKAWVVFISVVGYALLYPFIFLAILPLTSETVPVFAIGLSPAAFGYLLWIFSILKFVSRAHEVGSKALTNLSLVSFAIILVYAVLSYCVLIEALTDGWLISVLHLVTMVSLFFSMFYASYLIKSSELRRGVSLSECLGEFLLIWIFPVGIWVLQPRLNKLAR